MIIDETFPKASCRGKISKEKCANPIGGNLRFLKQIGQIFFKPLDAKVGLLLSRMGIVRKDEKNYLWLLYALQKLHDKHLSLGLRLGFNFEKNVGLG